MVADRQQQAEQGEGLQDNREHQQGADQVLQLMAWAFIPVWNDWRQCQVKQAKKSQVKSISVLEVRDSIGLQAGNEGQQQSSCAR